MNMFIYQGVTDIFRIGYVLFLYIFRADSARSAPRPEGLSPLRIAVIHVTDSHIDRSRGPAEECEVIIARATGSAYA
jgi:hypothetical protein